MIAMTVQVCKIKFENNENKRNSDCESASVSGQREYDTRPQEEFDAFIERVDKEIQNQINKEDL